MKPILFNTEMVRAILDCRKTVTRRVVKPQPKGHAALLRTEFGEDAVYTFEDGTATSPHYRPGDILYVRETWTVWNENYEYKADVDDGYGPFCYGTLNICPDRRFAGAMLSYGNSWMRSGGTRPSAARPMVGGEVPVSVL